MLIDVDAVAQMLADAERFRWLVAEGSSSFYEAWIAANWKRRGATPIETELRAEIDRRRDAK